MEDGAAYREDQGKESSGDHFLSSPADHHPGEAETKGESPRGADPDPDVFLLPVSPCGEEALESDVAMDPWWWTVTLFLCFFCWSFLWVHLPLRVHPTPIWPSDPPSPLPHLCRFSCRFSPPTTASRSRRFPFSSTLPPRPSPSPSFSSPFSSSSRASPRAPCAVMTSSAAWFCPRQPIPSGVSPRSSSSSPSEVPPLGHAPSVSARRRDR